MRSKFKRNHCKKQKGGVEVTEGPYDTSAHRFMSKDNIRRHVEYMKSRKNIIEQEEVKKKQQYDDLIAREKEKKDKKFQEEQAKKKEELEERLQEANNVKEIDKATAENMGSIMKFASNASASVVSSVIASVFVVVQKLLSGSFVLAKGVAEGSGFLINKITSGTGIAFTTIMNTVLYNFFKYLFSFIFAIMFFVIVVVLIIYGATLFTRKSEENNNNTSSGGQKKCSSLLSDTINLNISDFSKFFSGENVTGGLDKAALRQYIPNVPKYDYIPDGSFSWSNPWGYAAQKTGITNTKIVGQYKSFAAGLRGAQRLVRELSGYSSETLIDRDELHGGRCDNELLIDINLIKDRKLLTNLNINTNDPNAVINIMKPKDIVWTLPEDKYIGKDLKMLPEKLLEHDEIAFHDKKKIAIPWVQKNDEYRLSCKNAYFVKNDPNDTSSLAHVLMDDIGTNTCTIDNSSKAYTIKNTKQRYAKTDNLGAFLN